MQVGKSVSWDWMNNLYFFLDVNSNNYWMKYPKMVTPMFFTKVDMQLYKKILYWIPY